MIIDKDGHTGSDNEAFTRFNDILCTSIEA